MSATTNDRWTCPTCGHTELLQVVTTTKRAAARLQRVMRDHSTVHARERVKGLPYRRPRGGR